MSVCEDAFEMPNDVVGPLKGVVKDMKVVGNLNPSASSCPLPSHCWGTVNSLEINAAKVTARTVASSVKDRVVEECNVW